MEAASEFGHVAEVPKPTTARVEQFSDVDALSGSLEAIESELQQLDAGPLEAEMRRVSVAGVGALSTAVNRRVALRGAARSDVYTFALVLSGHEGSRWCGLEPAANTIQCYRRGAEFDGVTAPGFRNLMIWVPAAACEGAADRLGLSRVLAAPRHRQVNVSPSRVPELANQLLGLLPATDGGAESSGIAQADFLDTLLLTLGLPVGVKHSGTGDSRRRALRRIEEYLREEGDERVPLSTLCEVGEVSERTLRRAFLEQYGVTPVAYLKSLRLNAVRRGLSGSSLPEHVADVANRFGFWHLGQFAADYRAFFGELPSETLARARLRRGRF